MFWDFIEEEIRQAENENQGVIIQMDGNLHARDNFIKMTQILKTKMGDYFWNICNVTPHLLL